MVILDLKTFAQNYVPINEELELDDIITSKFGHKKKIRTPEGINIKVKGQSISKEEILGFFDTIKKYLSVVPFSKLKEHDKGNRGKEIRHDDLEFTYDNRGLVDKIIERTGKKGTSIDIDYGGGRVVFKRKEGQATDKIKLILLPKFLQNEDNSQLLDELIDDVIKKDEISTELSDEYDAEHDNNKVKGEEENEQEREKEYKAEEEKNKEQGKTVDTEHVDVPEKIVPVKEVADPVTARKICDVLLSQRLYVATADTDETALFELLTEGDTPLLLDCNSATIDLVCDLYIKSPKPIGAATSNLKRDDTTNTVSDKIVGFSDWALKSTGIDNYKSSGVVSDLLYGYDNLVKQKASPVVIQGMSAMDGTTTKGINAHLGELGLAIIGGAMVATGIGGARVGNRLMGSTAGLTRLVARKTAKGGIKALLGKLGTKMLGSVTSVVGIGKLLARSVTWIGAALTVYEGLSWWRDYSVESQGDQVTKILYLLQFSGSTRFKQELIKVGIAQDFLNAEKLKTSASKLEFSEEQ